MKNNKNQSNRPFGLQFLETVATEQLDQVAGGVANQGPVFTTQAISMPVTVNGQTTGQADRF